MNSGGPYRELVGVDVYNNGRGRARPPDVARNKLEGFGSCPVFTGSRMYVRTRQHLYCIGRSEAVGQ